MRIISSILSFFYIAGIFLLADSSVVSKLSPYNPYSLLHIPLYGILTALLIFSLIPMRFYPNNPTNSINSLTPKSNKLNETYKPIHFELSASSLKLILIAGSIALGVAIADEIYQSFIPGRDASIIDIFLDLIGITFVLFLFHQLYKGKKARIYIQAND
jgi:hypothetical protein